MPPEDSVQCGPPSVGPHDGLDLFAVFILLGLTKKTAFASHHHNLVLVHHHNLDAGRGSGEQFSVGLAKAG